MATVSAYGDTGQTVRAVIHNSELQFADVVAEAMEDYDDTDLDDYDIAATEIGATGEYHATWPDWLDPGSYTIQFIPLAGGTIAETDFPNRLAVQSYYYDGTNLVPDWAYKLAAVANPVDGSGEQRIKALDELLETGGAGDAAAILADTDELQGNQGDWATAEGFSTHSAADVVTALGTGSTLTDCLTADVSALALETTAQNILTDTDALDTLLKAGGAGDAAAILADTGTTLPALLATISGYVDCLPATLDGSTFTALPAVALTAAAQTALVAAIEAEIADDATGEAVKQAIIDKLIENLPDLDDLTLAAIANAARDAILDRVLAGNHDTAGTAGKLLQDAYSGTPTTAAEIADAVLARGVENVEDTAGKHSLGAMVMIGTNSSVSGSTLTAKKPSDDTAFETYTLATDANATPATGIS
jgi:hypothetical protein